MALYSSAISFYVPDREQCPVTQKSPTTVSEEVDDDR
jgi:hypothetical protein